VLPHAVLADVAANGRAAMNPTRIYPAMVVMPFAGSVAPDTIAREFPFSFKGPLFRTSPVGAGQVGPAKAIATPVNCSILYTDVAGYGDPRRDDDDRRVVRDVLYGTLRGAFEAAGVPWTGCRHEDRGDGTLSVVPPSVPVSSLVDPLMPLIADKLRRYNGRAHDAARVQLRAALHTGPVSADENGLTGHALIHGARLLDARILRRSLIETGADLAVMASGNVYDNVVRDPTGLVNPTDFRRVRFTVKESRISAWLYLP
jgi:hypothetical protein